MTTEDTSGTRSLAKFQGVLITVLVAICTTLIMGAYMNADYSQKLHQHEGIEGHKVMVERVNALDERVAFQLEQMNKRLDVMSAQMEYQGDGLKANRELKEEILGDMKEIKTYIQTQENK